VLLSDGLLKKSENPLMDNHTGKTITQSVQTITQCCQLDEIKSF